MEINQFKRKTMKNSILLLAVAGVFSFFLLSGCKKELNSIPSGDTSNVNSVNDLKVPADFNWEMTMEVSLNLGMNFPGDAYKFNTIRIFDGDPYSNGRLIFTGYTGNDNRLMAKARIRTDIKSLFLQFTPFISVTQIVEVPVAKTISYTFFDPDLN